MKVTPISAPLFQTADPSSPPQTAVQNIRSLKMRTNATPLGYSDIPKEEEGEENKNDPQQQQHQQLSNPEGVKTEAQVEATEPISPQLALLAKQRRSLQLRQRELEAREKALSEKANTSSIDLARLKQEPLSVLLENGITYDQLTESLMNNPQSNSEIAALKAKIEELQKGIDQRFLDNDAKAEKAALAEMEREAKSLSSSEDFELIRETNSLPHVMTLIERTYKETGELLTTYEAMKLVEEELFKDAQRIAALNKMKKALNPEPQMQQQPQQRAPGMRTLTNKDSASVPMSARARALAAFHGTLKR